MKNIKSFANFTKIYEAAKFKISLNNTPVVIEKLKYRNDRIALEATKRGELYAVLTVNLPDEVIPENTAFIDINNNKQSVIDTLIKEKIIDTKPLSFAQSGYVRYPLYTVLI